MNRSGVVLVVRWIKMCRESCMVRWGELSCVMKVVSWKLCSGHVKWKVVYFYFGTNRTTTDSLEFQMKFWQPSGNRTTAPISPIYPITHLLQQHQFFSVASSASFFGENFWSLIWYRRMSSFIKEDYRAYFTNKKDDFSRFTATGCYSIAGPNLLCL